MCGGRAKKEKAQTGRSGLSLFSCTKKDDNVVGKSRAARFSRGVGRRLVESGSAGFPTRASSRLGLSFRGSAAKSIGASWFGPVPVRPSWFPTGPFGFSRSAVAPLVFRRAGNSSLRVT